MPVRRRIAGKYATTSTVVAAYLQLQYHRPAAKVPPQTTLLTTFMQEVDADGGLLSASGQ